VTTSAIVEGGVITCLPSRGGDNDLTTGINVASWAAHLAALRECLGAACREAKSAR
jgi:hypothetical protein